MIKTKPSVSSAPAPQEPQGRLLWMLPPGREQAAAGQLRTKLASHGFVVYLMAFDSAPGAACRLFDLIILQVGSQTPDKMADQVAQIRTHTYAPLLLLTDHATLEWLLAVLPAGADAVMALDAPEEIILARCLALRRRWHNRPL